MLIRYNIILRLKRTNNASLLTFIKRVAVMLNGNVFYSGLINPTLPELNSMALTFENAIKAWGDRHNHGTTLDKENLKAARFAAEQMLRNIAKFCENKTPDNAIAFVSAGFDVTQQRLPVGLLPRVEDFRQFRNGVIPPGAVRLKWKRPLGIKQNGVKTYRVLNGPTSDPTKATCIATVTKTSFLDLKAGNRPSNFYWIIPVGTAGYGVISNVVTGYSQGPVIG